jgi:hypothetical protein
VPARGGDGTSGIDTQKAFFQKKEAKQDVGKPKEETMRRKSILLAMVTLAVFLASWIPIAHSKEVTDWELLVPEGVVIKAPLKLAPRITSLEGKTVALRWNGKPNGEIMLNKLAELLKGKIPTIKIVKLYEVERSTIHTEAPGSTASSVDAEAKMIKEKYKPDLVIGSQAD